MIFGFYMRRIAALYFCCAAVMAQGTVPTPRSYLGFTPGDDYKLADSTQIYGYFHKLAESSDRIRLQEFGRSALGKPMYVAFISAPENLQKLDRFREISRRLALGEAPEEQARALAGEGRAIVWIDSGLHASEVAPVQQAPDLAYRLLAGESTEIRNIRRNVILLQVPVINPDGLDWVVQWYRRNVGTPYESAPLPWLYQKYAGHDNNRDWFMLNLQETREVTRLAFREWLPQVLYNQHQAPPFPARIFVPPYAEPLNPNIPAAVMQGINRIGMAMQERFARENKPGVLSYWGYDAWWNGGLRSASAFHNIHGILTETAGYAYATPHEYPPAAFPTSFASGMPAREPSIFYARPWQGGTWTLRDAIEYMLTADFAILDEAASRRSDFLLKSWQMARASINSGDQGKPFAYVLSPEQWDRPTALEMLERLSLAGVVVRRAREPFHAAGRLYPAGSFVIPAAQPFRPYLVDLLEPQRFPTLKLGPNGPARRPYDIAGWTLSMQMGVAVDRIEERFTADLAPASEFRTEGAVGGKGPVVILDHRENNAFLATAFFTDRNETVRWAADGSILVDSPYIENGENRARVDNFAREFGLHVRLADAPPAKPLFELHRPRVALYQPFVANADEGWTEWLFDRYRVPYTLVHNADFGTPGLRSRFDAIVIAAQAAASILNGQRSPEGPGGPPVVQRPEYAGGIGTAGLARLEEFIRDGGTLVALDAATEVPLQFFALPLHNLLQPLPSEFSCPGSLVRLTVDTTQPLAFGIPAQVIAFSTGGEAFDVISKSVNGRTDPPVSTVARFAAHDLLASGWISGAHFIEGKQALVDVRYGRGRVILFGFRPQFRGQPFATFKFLLNAVYLASAQPL